MQRAAHLLLLSALWELEGEDVVPIGKEEAEEEGEEEEHVASKSFLGSGYC